MIQSLGQISLTVLDLDRAVTFYGETLGLPLAFRVPNLAFFHIGSVRLMLAPPEPSNPAKGNSIFYLKVDDIDREHERLSTAGVRIEHAPRLVAPMPDHDLYMSFYRDSEENIFALMEERSRS